MTGHIKLDRKILSWEWYNDANTFRVFVHLLLNATHKDGRYRGMEIKRGEVVTGRLKLATALRLSEMEIRTCLNKLKMTNEITMTATNKFSIISICKYDVYQSFKNENNQQNDQLITQRPTNNQPTTNQQLTTFNNDNNDNNVISNNTNNNGLPPDVFFGTAYYPLAKDFNGLPDVHMNSYINLIRVVKKVDVEKEDVAALWEIFKDQHLTGETEYKDKAEVYRHFINSNKNHSFRKKPKEKPKESKDVRGVEFLNDFNDCKMSDGTIKKLTVNQQDSARFNQISPNSIVK